MINNEYFVQEVSEWCEWLLWFCCARCRANSWLPTGGEWKELWVNVTTTTTTEATSKNIKMPRTRATTLLCLLICSVSVCDSVTLTTFICWQSLLNALTDDLRRASPVDTLRRRPLGDFLPRILALLSSPNF